MDAKINPPASLVRALISRGWCFRDTDQIEGLIAAKQSSSDSFSTVDLVESELLNMDLRSIGGKSLPETSALCKSSHLRGPIVLQVCSTRDITQSCIGEKIGGSGSRQLLQLKLTDGHSEINAVELSHVPLIHEDVIPGTKVRLQNKVDLCNGIMCLKNKVITILGGGVQCLYEEWLMKRKYMVDSHYTLKLSRENASSCPPPFEKLRIHAPVQGIARPSGSSSNDNGQSLAGKDGTSNLSQTLRIQDNDPNMDGATGDVKLLQDTDKDKEKTTFYLTRPKVAASIPVQNQIAAQKLLQKTSQPNYNDRNSRSQRNRGKIKLEESSLLTLDEWEKRKTAMDIPTRNEYCSIGQDEDLARQLQKQFDLEDIHEQKSYVVDAEYLKMSMFNFERDNSRAVNTTGLRGRGRGRGRKMRGRGRVQH